MPDMAKLKRNNSARLKQFALLDASPVRHLKSPKCSTSSPQNGLRSAATGVELSDKLPWAIAHNDSPPLKTSSTYSIPWGLTLA